jgi:hypothetical protein
VRALGRPCADTRRRPGPPGTTASGGASRTAAITAASTPGRGRSARAAPRPARRAGPRGRRVRRRRRRAPGRAQRQDVTHCTPPVASRAAGRMRA